jgi:hypothetical protein
MVVKAQSYDELVDRWVYGAVTRGVTTFNSLVAALPGVYPTVVRDSLQRLIATGKLTNHNFASATVELGIERSELTQPSESCHSIVLPIPHPLDFDWRFGDSAVKYLLDTCLELTNPSDKIALLGTPSVMRYAIESSYPRKIILLDSNSEVVKCLASATSSAQVIHCDVLRNPLPQIEASVVIVDPPWYEEHIKGFLWAGAELCQTGGHMLVSIPPVGTRPGIEQDRENLFEWLQKLNLEQIRIETAILPYVSPPFEINALKAAGFHAILEEWRRGDLGVFTRKDGQLPPRPMFPAASEDNWIEEIIQGVRIRVRPHESSEFEDPRLLSVVAGNILPSASRREERRVFIDVWTSGNRVYACEGRSVLRHILRALAKEKTPEEFVAQNLGRKLSADELRLVTETAKKLAEIISLERNENLLLRETCTNA